MARHPCPRSFFSLYGFLYADYDRETFYWESLMYMRRLVVQVVSIMFDSDFLVQSFLLWGTSIFNLLMNVLFEPYNDQVCGGAAGRISSRTRNNVAAELAERRASDAARGRDGCCALCTLETPGAAADSFTDVATPPRKARGAVVVAPASRVCDASYA